MYANPYNKCDRCGLRTTNGAIVQGIWRNFPCGHNASFSSVCPSWSPVDGCECPVECMVPEDVYEVNYG